MFISASVPTPEQTLASFADILNRELNRWLALSEQQIQKLYGHYELLVRWNRRMNLTSIKPGPELVIRHYCESLFFGAHLPAETEAITIIDMGSGAGFPGVPVAVLKQSWQVTLVESVQRKAVFLRESTRGLSNVSVKDQRIEDLPVKADWLVARAVNPSDVLSNIPRVASNVGLMLGEDDFSLLQKYPHIAWAEPVRLPWGDRRLCVYGKCST